MPNAILDSLMAEVRRNDVDDGFVRTARLQSVPDQEISGSKAAPIERNMGIAGNNDDARRTAGTRNYGRSNHTEPVEVVVERRHSVVVGLAVDHTPVQV